MRWWAWSDAAFVLTFVTAVLTLLIPVSIFWLGRTDSKRATAVRNQQTAVLRAQEALQRRGRRDQLVDRVGEVSDPRHLAILWAEVREFVGDDGALLRSAIRANPAVPLPGSTGGERLSSDADTARQAVRDYVAALERRYATRDQGGAFSGLAEFLEVAVRSGARGVDLYGVAAVVTGHAAAVQEPGHQFFRRLALVAPDLCGSLLHRVEDISPTAVPGLRLNVLTGCVLALKDADLGHGIDGRRAMSPAEVAEIRASASGALAHLLHRDVLRHLDTWQAKGSTEPVSATVAWLIRAVGMLVDEDVHLGMRMVENLAAVIRSTPEADRRWGMDAADVVYGLDRLRLEAPGLWEHHGDEIQAAVAEIGPIGDSTLP